MPKQPTINEQIRKLTAAVAQLTVVQGNARAPKPRAPQRPQRKRRSNRSRNPVMGMTLNGSSTAVDCIENIPIAGSATAGMTTKILIGPSNSGFAHLNKFKAIYSRYQLVSCSIEFVPSLGSTVGGTVLCGWDPNPVNVKNTLTSVSALSPQFVVNISQKGRMVIPSSALARIGELFTDDAGSIQPSQAYFGAVHFWNPSKDPCGYLIFRIRARFSGQGG
jgi:hypothetical protein